MLSPQRLCQIEVQVTDLSRATRFYATVFGWEAVPADLFQYAILSVPDDSPFGISLLAAPGNQNTTSRSTLFLKMESAEELQELIERVKSEQQGETLKTRVVPGYGVVWTFSDPDGQKWGLFLEQKPKHQRGV